MRNTILATATAIVAAAACLCLTFGGCRNRPVSESASAVAGGATKAGCVEIGRDPARLARLEETVRVNATVYHAETGNFESAEAEILPGTWLLPASAFEAPEGKAGKDEP